MTTYNTGNPIGSKDPRDLYDNAENLDEAVNTRQAESWNDRFGVARKTWWGMEQDFQQFLIDSGYVNIGDYGPGLEITERNQIFWRDGELYRAGSSLELPYTTTGDWGSEEGLFVAVGDAALRQDLSDSNDQGKGADLIGYRGRTVHETLDDFYNIKSLGAQGDGVTDDTAHIQNAIDSGVPALFFPEGLYPVQQITLRDGLTLRGPGRIFVSTNSHAGIVGENVTNVTFEGVKIEGTGEPGEDLVALQNCSGFTFVGCDFSKSGRLGLRMFRCENMVIKNNTFRNNYYYGIEDKEGVGNKFYGNFYFKNGDTGTHQSTSTTGSPGGRGLTLWGCKGNIVFGETYIDNTEYGLRVYSHGDDVVSSEGILIDNCYFKDNGKRDFSFSNTDNVDFKIKNCSARNVIIERTVVDAFHIDVFSVQGENTYVDAVTIINNTGQTLDLFSVYNSRDCVVENVTANDTTYINIGSNTGLTIDNVRLYGCDRLIEQLLGNYVVKNCIAVANPGANFALAIVVDGVGGIVLDSNRLSGFDIAIRTDGVNSKFSMIDNIVEDSGTYAWEASTTNNHIDCVIRGNRFDSVRFPYHNGWDSNGYRTTVRHSGPISRGTWVRGDMIWNSSPTGGTPTGWLCTSSGEPPTWVAMANL